MFAGTVLRMVGLVALVAAIAACSDPTPRGYAHQGVPAVGDRSTHNAAYYLGADSAQPRAGRGGAGP